MEVRYERKDSGTGAADRRPSHRLYFQEDDQRKDALLSSVDRKWEEAQPISAGWRTGAAAGANRAAQSIAGTAERAASQDAQSAPAKVGL